MRSLIIKGRHTTLWSAAMEHMSYEDAVIFITDTEEAIVEDHLCMMQAHEENEDAERLSLNGSRTRVAPHAKLKRPNENPEATETCKDKATEAAEVTEAVECLSEVLAYAVTKGSKLRKLLFNIKKWRRDSVLKLVGVDPSDSHLHYEYHRRQDSTRRNLRCVTT